jgi:hypothetical protein
MGWRHCARNIHCRGSVVAAAGDGAKIRVRRATLDCYLGRLIAAAPGAEATRDPVDETRVRRTV